MLKEYSTMYISLQIHSIRKKSNKHWFLTYEQTESFSNCPFFWFLTHCVIWHSGGTGWYPETRITDNFWILKFSTRLLGTYLYRHYYVAKYVHTDLVILKECSKQLHKIQIQWQPTCCGEMRVHSSEIRALCLMKL